LLKEAFDHHPIIARVLLLAAIFLSGCFEAFFIKQKELACLTWFTCLGALTVWIAYSLTMVSVVIATVIFTSGMILLVIYYRRARIAQLDE